MSRTRTTTTQASTENQSASSLDATVIYAGPTMHRRVIIAGSVYRDGIPANIQALIEKIPDVGRIIVPVKDFSSVRQAAKTEGTEYHRLYNALLTVRFDGEEVRK